MGRVMGGLDASVIILNWNHGKRDQSLKFFADRGNRQILCGFYDNDLSQWQEWLDSGRKVKGNLASTKEYPSSSLTNKFIPASAVYTKGK